MRDEQAAQLHAYVDRVSADDFTREVEVLENGTVPLIECLYTVFEQLSGTTATQCETWSS